jgi:hypothetical protein
MKIVRLPTSFQSDLGPQHYLAMQVPGTPCPSCLSLPCCDQSTSHLAWPSSRYACRWWSRRAVGTRRICTLSRAIPSSGSHLKCLAHQQEHFIEFYVVWILFCWDPGYSLISTHFEHDELVRSNDPNTSTRAGQRSQFFRLIFFSNIVRFARNLSCENSIQATNSRSLGSSRKSRLSISLYAWKFCKNTLEIKIPECKKQQRRSNPAARRKNKYFLKNSSKTYHPACPQ